MAIVVTALAVMFILSVLANPVLPNFKLRQLVSLPHKEDIKPKRPNLPTNPEESVQVRLQETDGNDEVVLQQEAIV